jgi:hypothetical protein
MGKTPGMLNPLTYSSEAELRQALLEQGKERGWTPFVETDEGDD